MCLLVEYFCMTLLKDFQNVSFLSEKQSFFLDRALFTLLISSPNHIKTNNLPKSIINICEVISVKDLKPKVTEPIPFHEIQLLY